MRKINYPNPEENCEYWIEQLHNSMRGLGIKCAVRFEPKWRKKSPQRTQAFYLYSLTNKKERGLIIEANLKLAKTIREKYLWLLQRKKPQLKKLRRRNLQKNLLQKNANSFETPA